MVVDQAYMSCSPVAATSGALPAFCLSTPSTIAFFTAEKACARAN